MRSPLFAVASLAVDVTVWTVASDDRIEGLVAIVALEALAMPWATFSQNFFSCEDDTSATRAAFTWCGLNAGGVNDRDLGSLSTVKQKYLRC